MKNLNLNAYGVEEMNIQEMGKTEGGSLIASVIFIAAFVSFLFLCDAHPQRVELY